LPLGMGSPKTKHQVRIACVSQSKTTSVHSLSKPEAWRALAALCLGFFMVLMDQTIVAVATPDIMAHFDTEFDQVVWVTSIYLLCMVVPLLFTGRLGDRFGQARMFQLGISVFVLAALA